ncbi:MAG TPA: HBL/NHE enterotoxin family protein [Thermoanaerobaculia bacterium]|jgi:hypothetical protein
MSVLALAPSTGDDVTREVTAMQAKISAYWQSVNLITLNAHAIRQQVLQNVDEDNPPAWWDKLSTNFTNCQSHALMWIDTIYPSLTAIPQAIIDYNTYFSLASTRIVDLLEKIGDKQPTPEQKVTLLLLLTLLSSKLKSCMANVEHVRADIKSFTSAMANDHQELTKGSASVTKAIEQASARMVELTAEIAALHLEIAELNAQVVAAGIAMGTTLIVSYVLMSVSPWIAVPLAIIGIGISLGFIIDGLVRINQKRKQIVEDSATLVKTEAQVVVLNAIATTVNAMMVSIDAILKNIDAVSTAWATLDVKMQSIVTDLKSATDEHWMETLLQLIDVKAAQIAWKQLEKYAEQLQEIKLADSGHVEPVQSVA